VWGVRAYAGTGDRFLTRSEEVMEAVYRDAMRQPGYGSAEPHNPPPGEMMHYQVLCVCCVSE
jgi:hypothetical protein